MQNFLSFYSLIINLDAIMHKNMVGFKMGINNF